jgi:hypothetical protein
LSGSSGSSGTSGTSNPVEMKNHLTTLTYLNI